MPLCSSSATRASLAARVSFSLPSPRQTSPDGASSCCFVSVDGAVAATPGTFVFPPIRACPDAVVAAPGTSCRHQIHHATGAEPMHPVAMAARILLTPSVATMRAP